MQTSDRRSSSSTKVYVVAENRLLRETLVRLFRKRGDVNIVGNTCCSETTIKEVASTEPDLLLLDYFDKKPTSDDWLGDVQEAIPEIKVILFGMDEDPEFFLRAVRRGVVGYVLKSASAADLMDAIRTVA